MTHVGVDKFGTIFHDGDTWELLGTGRTYTAVPTRKEDMEASMVVKRADGSPVYRYKGGEDVRVGDEYEYNGCGGTVAYLSRDLEMSQGIGLALCTLFRRAEEKATQKQPGKTLQEYAAEKSEQRVVDRTLEAMKRNGETLRVGPLNRCPIDDRPILGKDRNGR